ncbi:Uridylate kinase [Candidatus Erwinia haradaeae]|uniref:Uridylate kinase n=1 Tax=Candidatus Erwinia haradaeae TaxID=1922217 RepID=A0A451DJB1_9GAMM|nr:UMP kinase [Candidatus Erwinia haradaeae]VFP86755.1 Uridylate kinase [Candidatus Erwinia haradaeae]
MATYIKPVYQRILLKLSGEAFQGPEGFGINAGALNRMAIEVKELVALGIQVGIVIGGGNLFRGSGLARAGMNRVVGDQMGMLATVMNGLAMRDAMCRAYMKVTLMSAIPLNGVCDTYCWDKANSLLQKNHVVIFSAGIGNPLFTTDSAACLRGIEIKANAVLKATKVDGVYSADPNSYPEAVLYEKLTYSEVLSSALKVMDLAAFTLARDHGLPIRVFNMNKPGALRRILMGNKEGTLITN